MAIWPIRLAHSRTARAAPLAVSGTDFTTAVMVSGWPIPSRYPPSPRAAAISTGPLTGRDVMAKDNPAPSELEMINALRDQRAVLQARERGRASRRGRAE